MILDENSLRKNLFSLGIHVQSKWTFIVRNVGLGSGFRKKKISRPKLCFRVIRPRIIFHRVRDQFCFGLPSLFFFIFISNRFFGFLFNSFFLLHFFFLAFSLCFCLLIFLEGVSLTTFGTPFFLIFAFQHQAFDRL